MRCTVQALSALLLTVTTLLHCGGGGTKSPDPAPILSAPVISYTPNSASGSVGMPLTLMAPTNTGGAASSWGVVPALPTGLSLNATTGQLSGTPIAASAATTYIVTATNMAGSGTATLSITVTATPGKPVISYTPATLAATLGTAITPLTPTNTGGTAASWSITPALPTGLNLSATTGQVSGTPTVASVTTTYTVTATNTAGSGAATLSITVTATLQKPTIAYTPATLAATLGTAITPMTPTNAGGAAASWSITPALPADLGLNANTGQISGTPTIASVTTTYTVTATNTAGTGSTTLSITVTGTAVPVASVSLDSKPSTPIEAYTTLQLAATVLPTTATNKSLVWTSSLPAVSTVSAAGLVTGLTAGTTRITVTTVDGGKTDFCDVTVTVAPPPPGAPTIPLFFIKDTAGGHNLAWYVRGADSMTIDQSVGPVTDASGQVSIGTPSTPTTYTLTATNTKGVTHATTTFMPLPGGKPSVETFFANPSIISSGGASTITWGIAYSTTGTSIDQGVGPVSSPGRVVVYPTTTTTYTLTLTGMAGTSTRQVTVWVVSAPPSGGSTYYAPDLLQSPIDSTIATNLAAIAAVGTGLRPNAFMKVGDSITVNSSTLGPFAADAGLNWGSHADLQPAVAYFRGAKVPAEAITNSFNRPSLAAEVGTGSDWATSGAPSPLDAEFQVAFPQYAVVMYGTNEVMDNNPGTPPHYHYATKLGDHQRNLMKVVDALLAKGVIPILTTLPPRNDLPRDQVAFFAALERSIAQGRGIPLIDYSQAMMALGAANNYGLLAGDIHPSTAPSGAGDLSATGLKYGYNLRNLLTLTALSRLKAVMVDAAAVPDPAAAHLAGSGTVADSYVIPGLPFSDFRNTQTSSSQSLNGYQGGDTPVPGKEVVYKLVMTQSAPVRIVMVDRGASLMRVFLLDQTCTPGGCLASDKSSAEGEIVYTLAAGTYHIVVDSKNVGGEYSLMVLPN